MLDETKTRMKCPHCKGEIVLEDDDVLYFGFKNKDFYHTECLIEKETSKKRGGISEDEVEDFINSIKTETYDMKKFYIDRNSLYQWIHQQYRMVVIPKYFRDKMEKIFEGIYDGLTQGIPPEHILDMWKRLFSNNKLSEIRQYNVRRGLKLSGVDLLNYELAIVIGKYDSYLDWREKLRYNRGSGTEQVELLTRHVRASTELTEKQLAEKKEQEEINQMIDDIFDIEDD